MPPETPTPNETPRNDSSQPEQSLNDSAQNESTQQKPEVPRGALQKALLRTLRGDISSTHDTSGTEARSAYVPEGGAHTSSLPPTSPAHTREAPKPPEDAIVHTLRDDVSHMVQSEKLSLVRMAALEGDKAARTQNDSGVHTSRDPWKLVVKVLLIIFVLVALGVAGAAGYYAYRIAGVPQQTQRAPGIVFAEGREVLDITGQSAESVRALFSSLRTTRAFTLGSLTEIVFVQTLTPKSLAEQPQTHDLSASEFLALLRARVPDTFVEALGDRYMFGMHARELRNEPFLILTTSSYSFAFSGMLSWEKTMAVDLSGIFVPNDATAQASFVDDVYENLDVRILYDTAGSELLVYGFVGRSTLIITTNTNTFAEIANRLRAQPGY